MDQDPCRVHMIIGIASDMRPAIHHQDTLTRILCQTLCEDTSRKTSTYNEIIVLLGHKDDLF
jgi:hypothetical protein